MSWMGQIHLLVVQLQPLCCCDKHCRGIKGLLLQRPSLHLLPRIYSRRISALLRHHLLAVLCARSEDSGCGSGSCSSMWWALTAELCPHCCLMRVHQSVQGSSIRSYMKQMGHKHRQISWQQVSKQHLCYLFVQSVCATVKLLVDPACVSDCAHKYHWWSVSNDIIVMTAIKKQFRRLSNPRVGGSITTDIVSNLPVTSNDLVTH